MTEVPNQGDPCICGSVDTWHPECYALREGRETEIQKLRALMAEAVRDFHGKAVLFSAAFLHAAEPQKKQRRTQSRIGGTVPFLYHHAGENRHNEAQSDAPKKTSKRAKRQQ